MNSPGRPERSTDHLLGDEALARLLLRHGVGQGEQAAVRAFGRIVDATALASTLLQRLNLADPEADGTIEPSLRRFCTELALLPTWDFSPVWLARLMDAWAECYLAGAVVEFPFIAMGKLIELCQQRLLGERDMVYRLEMDILSAMVRLGWCLGGILSEVSIEREHSFRLFAEDGDPVLGIPNRRHFLALLERYLADAEGRLVGLLIVQVDWGRSVGVLPMDERDGLRLAFTEAIQANLRSEDTLCALSEEEWAVILPDLNNPAQVALAGHKLVDSCEILLGNAFPFLNGRFCAGGAWALEHANEPLGLEQAARSALIVARSSGRFFDVYCSDLAKRARADADMESDVLRAFEACQFELFLQPQMSLATRRPVGAEALLRWRREDGSVVGPDRILPVLERMGMLPALSRWVIQRAVQALAELSAAACPARISINLLAADLKDPELPLFILQACQTWRVEPGRLGCEISEICLSPDDAQIAATLAGLAELGGRVALDDFGTGYASMDYLRRLPVKELKLDKSLVQCLIHPDQAIVELIIRIAHGFGLQVLAKGVESDLAADQLAALGCDLAQGFLYAKAMPVEVFAAWWRAAESA